MPKRLFWLVPCFLLLASLGPIASGLSTSLSDDYVYDINGFWEGPILCPLQIPSAGYVGFTGQVRVNKYGVPVDDRVPFYPSLLTYTNQIQPVTIGFGWYRPSPNTTYYEGLDWIWDGPGGGGGMHFRCTEYRYLWGALIFRNAAFTHPVTGVWGYALVDGEESGGTDTRIGSGGGEGQTCYEIFEWWYDLEGAYQEQVLYSWCEGYET